MKKWCAIVFVVGVFVLAAAVFSGPLDPPAGAIQPTSPSLADIGIRLDEIEAANRVTSGPWQSWALSADGGTPNQLNAQTIVPGRLLVHQVSVFRGYVAIFDGEGGVIDSEARVLSGAVIGHLKHQGNSANGQGQLVTAVLPLDVVCEDGLALAFRKEFTNMQIQILYKVLPE